MSMVVLVAVAEPMAVAIPGDLKTSPQAGGSPLLLLINRDLVAN